MGMSDLVASPSAAGKEAQDAAAAVSPREEVLYLPRLHILRSPFLP